MHPQALIVFFLTLFSQTNASWFWGSSPQKHEPSMVSTTTGTDLLKSLVGNIMTTDTHFPRIFRTPHSYNAFFDLPGFHPQDLHVSVDEDTIHVEGHTWCPKSSEQSSWFGERFVSSERDLCVERHVNAHVTLPRNMREHGNVRALFENGVLRVSVPLHREEHRGYARRLVDVLTGGSSSSNYNYGNTPVEEEGTGRGIYESARRNAEHAGERVREGVNQAQDAASRGAEYVGDTARYVREKGAEYGEEYVKKPMQRAGANVAERVRDAGQNVADRAEDVKQRIRSNPAQEAADHSKGIYERASEAIHNAADTVMHPFRKGGGPMDTESMRKGAGQEHGYGGSDYISKQNIPVKEGRVVNEF